MTQTHEPPASKIDPLEFRRVMGQYPTGVSVITSADENGYPVAGMTAGTFTSVSLDPPLVAFLPAKTSKSWPLIEATGRFCINVLSDTQTALSKSFSSSGGDKFAGVSWHLSQNGLPIIDDVIAWIECELHSVVDAGDHVIVLGQVTNMKHHTEGNPLVFHGGKFNRPLPL